MTTMQFNPLISVAGGTISPSVDLAIEQCNEADGSDITGTPNCTHSYTTGLTGTFLFIEGGLYDGERITACPAP